ncbi:urea hydro-lyase/cyanamide hydratase [Penicillium brasilianum]|uniref:Urea hydro-lyase/cyanamide hydratase n=1 Tax=Penicillium brasilianum TaxID=104259 RepID=A0A1S9S0U1_PENBI|nr:urea hydro-lyase/cyanamide hydratase [Penicillium brasilianum]
MTPVYEPTETAPDSLSIYGFTAVPASASSLLSSVTTSTPAPFIPVSETSVPDTVLSERIKRYAQSCLPVPTYHHSLRVYHYGLAIKKHLFPSWKFSDETYFLTCVLHDIGSTEENMTKTKLSFEFYGGLLALNVLQESTDTSALGATASRDLAESVAEAIIRHQDFRDQGQITAVGQLLQLATALDNVGAHAELVHPMTIEDISRHYPRQQWSHCFAATLRKERELKPWSHTTVLGEEAPARVLGNKLMAPFE